MNYLFSLRIVYVLHKCNLISWTDKNCMLTVLADDISESHSLVGRNLLQAKKGFPSLFDCLSVYTENITCRQSLIKLLLCITSLKKLNQDVHEITTANGLNQTSYQPLAAIDEVLNISILLSNMGSNTTNEKQIFYISSFLVNYLLFIFICSLLYNISSTCFLTQIHNLDFYENTGHYMFLCCKQVFKDCILDYLKVETKKP